jgi:multidrug efflux pump subunit AcrB
MIVRTYWPGATIDDTMPQVTDRIEKKLQETPSLYCLKSETNPGVSTIYVHVLDNTPKERSRISGIRCARKSPR